MGLEKLVKKLGELMADEQDTERSNCDDIREVLVKLEKKKRKLEQKLKDSDDVSTRKKIKLELKIIDAQLKKGENLILQQCS